MRNNRNRRRKKQATRIELPFDLKKILIVSAVFMIILCFSTIFALTTSLSNKVIARVSVNGINVSNLTIDEAYQKLNNELKKQKEKNIVLKHEEYETTISLEQLEVKYKTDEAVNKAYKLGRSNNILISNFQIIANLLFGNKIKQEIEINEEELDKAISDIEVKIPNAVVQSSYYIENEQLIITRGKEGFQLKKDELKNTLIQAIKEQIQGKDVKEIQLPVEDKKPEEINIEKIYQEIYKEAQNAHYDEENKKLYKEENGIDFAISREEAQNIVKEEKEEYSIPLKIVKPEIKVADLAGENFFPTLLAKFTTRYDESAENRANNIKLSSEKINGTILMPNEIFSYNKIVGERTIKAGYKEASVYMGGKIVPGIGGGICQVSSTLYNAALLANLEITERRNHYFITSYVSQSRDATVSYGSIDFKFKNTRNYPIKVECISRNGICQVFIYGMEEEVEYEVEIQDKVTEVIPYTTKTIKTDELAKGENLTVQKGVNGYKSEAYRILKQNGQVISKTLLSKDSYNPLQEVIKEGTK
ncbi:MAG: VanW family protein [Clostridia bacterium]|nr:VanW family protein [Clostridia bacterium]